MCAQQGHCGFPRRTLCLLNTIEALYSLYSLYTQNIVSVTRISTGLKSPKNVFSDTNGVGKPPFGLKLCGVKAPGLPNPPDPTTGQKTKKKSKKSRKSMIFGILGPYFRRCGAGVWRRKSDGLLLLRLAPSRSVHWARKGLVGPMGPRASWGALGLSLIHI